MADEKTVLVQIRLPEAEAAELREAGQKANPPRSLPGEMRHRLDTFRAGDEGSFARALGDLVASVTNTVEANFAAGPVSPEQLGTVRDTLARIFNEGLGARDPGDANADLPLSRWAAFPIVRWLKSDPPMHDEPAFIKRIVGKLALDGKSTEPLRAKAKSPQKS